MASNIKAGVILFHKNVRNYHPKWVKKCIDSIRNQTFRDFTVYELDYSNTGIQVYGGSIFYSRGMNNHAEAHNFLLDEVFDDDLDCAFNVNIDDFYALNRFEKQIIEIERGEDVISSNFYRVDERDRIVGIYNFAHLNIKKEAARGHNIIAHPACCYSKNFWTKCTKLDPQQIPADDFHLWIRSMKNGFRFKILDEYLLYQRIHNNNVSKK